MAETLDRVIVQIMALTNTEELKTLAARLPFLVDCERTGADNTEQHLLTELNKLKEANGLNALGAEKLEVEALRAALEKAKLEWGQKMSRFDKSHVGREMNALRTTKNALQKEVHDLRQEIQTLRVAAIRRASLSGDDTNIATRPGSAPGRSLLHVGDSYCGANDSQGSHTRSSYHIHNHIINRPGLEQNGRLHQTSRRRWNLVCSLPSFAAMANPVIAENGQCSVASNSLRDPRLRTGCKRPASVLLTNDEHPKKIKLDGCYTDPGDATATTAGDDQDDQGSEEGEISRHGARPKCSGTEDVDVIKKETNRMHHGIGEAVDELIRDAKANFCHLRELSDANANLLAPYKLL
jgi:hypothetical protein